MITPLCILTIAGSDSGGGAGIQADQRTIRSIGGHALTAVTAVTAQDTRGIRAWRPVADSLLSAQLESALRGFPVAAVKTGLLPGAGAVRAVCRALSGFPTLPLVVDPVLSSSSGTVFLSGPGLRALRDRLLPMSSLVTPNWPEASALAGVAVRTHGQAERAALLLSGRIGRPVLVKGGHGRGRVCRDCLATADGNVSWYENPRIDTPNTHGTGCVLSAAVAAWLGRGADVASAVRLGRSFLQRALSSGSALDWGKGRGPAFAGSR